MSIQPPTDLRTRLAGALAFDEKTMHTIAREAWLNPAAVIEAVRIEAERLAPLHSALADCAALMFDERAAQKHWDWLMSEDDGADMHMTQPEWNAAMLEAQRRMREITLAQDEALARLGELLGDGEGRWT